MYTGSKEAPGLHRHICRYLLCLAGSISLPGLSELDHTIFKIYFVGLPEFPPETRHVSQVETWLLRGVNPNQTPRMLSPTKLSKSGGDAPDSGAPGSGVPGYGRTWVQLIAFSRCGFKFFFRFSQVAPG